MGILLPFGMDICYHPRWAFTDEHRVMQRYSALKTNCTLLVQTTHRKAMGLPGNHSPRSLCHRQPLTRGGQLSGSIKRSHSLLRRSVRHEVPPPVIAFLDLHDVVADVVEAV